MRVRPAQWITTRRSHHEPHPAGTAAGQGGFALKAKAAVDTGRLFVGQGGAKTQALIVAKSENTNLSASASANWKVATRNARLIASIWTCICTYC